MKVIAAILCLAATVNAAAVLPLESSLVKSDRVGDNFSYSIHQNHGYAVSPDLKEVVQPVVPSVDVKQPVVPTTYNAAVVPYAEHSIVPVELKSHVVPASTAYYAQQPLISVAAPVEVKQHRILPVSTAYIAQQPVVSVPVKTQVSPVDVKATEYKPVVPVVPSYYSSYIQPYVSSMYPYASYASVSYPFVRTDKYVN